jgi:predicted GNAT family acetyltransferase
MKIEAATKRDLSQIVRLKIRMFEDMAASWLLADNAIELITQSYHELYTQKNAQHFIMRVGDSVVACAGGFIKNDPPYCYFKTPFYGFIADAYTLPEYREKGYATALTQAAIDWLKGKNCNMIRLIASPQSHNIYEKMGFRGTDEMVLWMY